MIRTAQTFDGWHKELVLTTRPQATLGGIVIALTLGFGLLWSTLAPIAGAAIAGGVVVATGQNKAVQHLEGGIIEQILVREGDSVQAGAALMRMSETAARANLTRIATQLDALRLIEARYLAERDGLSEMTLPDDLRARAAEPGLASLIDGQKREFLARRQSLESQISVLQKQIDATNDQITGLEAQRQSADSQMLLINEELKDTRGLFKKGLAAKTRVLALERTAAELLGSKGAFTAQIAQARQSISETETRILSLREAWMEKTITELRDVQLQVADFQERFKAADDVATRLDIRAPVSGKIVKLHYNTPGAVITPGQTIADILPASALEIEARINPQDINRVRAGKQADIRFPALRSRLTPVVPAEVVYVSADRLSDPRTGEAYYVARLRLAENLDGPEREAAAKLVPGMPAEVHVRTGERTLVHYLFSPVSDIFSHAFREE